MRDLYLPLAEELGCVLLAPFFPAALTEDEETHNYIFLHYREICFDEILLSMVEEARKQFNLSVGKFWLAGFSGGAQFVNRFAYLHASRLAGVSIAAPGMITSLDTGQQWFAGIGGVEDHLGKQVDWAGMRQMTVHVAVGSNDTRPEVTIPQVSPLYCPGINDSGNTRVDRAKKLHELLIESGIKSQFDEVPNADHHPGDLMPAVAAYFRREFKSCLYV
jgi:pimeloyl-ACP methyl ester carboxylesterase